MALYNSADGDNWTDKSDWLSDRPTGQWYGVTTDVNGSVTHLDLNNNELSGEVPPELGSLSNLQSLRLGSNELSSEIPSELGSLSDLQWLNLSSNQLSGEIPKELGSLSNLQNLWLDCNQGLSGPLPGSLTGLNAFSRLDLRDTQLCALSDDAFQRWLLGVLEKSGVVTC